MPISTMLKGWSSRPVAAASTRTWPAISPAVRFRTRPILPVRQKPQLIAQPTCVEMQNVIDGVSGMNTRSEEDTSELQSQSNLVCRLLLEKKKKKKKKKHKKRQ